MSTKDRLITYSFKAKKGGTQKAEVKGKGEPVPSTSADKPSNYEKDLQLLKEFDLNWEFGPCIGITRLERWDRAKRHDLNPSMKVRELIQAHLDDERYTLCLWNDYKNII